MANKDLFKKQKVASVTGGIAAGWLNFESRGAINDPIGAVKIAGNSMRYYLTMASCKIKSLFAKGNTKEAAERTIAYGRVISDMFECVARMQGLSVEEARNLYSDHLMLNHEEEILKNMPIPEDTGKPQKKQTAAQKLSSSGSTYHSNNSQYNESVKILPTTSDITNAIAEKLPIDILGSIYDFINKGFEKLGKKEKDDMIVDNMVSSRREYLDGLNPFIESQKKVDEWLSKMYTEFTDLYMDCKKKKDFNSYHQKMESAVKETLLKFGMEIDPNFQSKVVQKKAEPAQVQNGAAAAMGRV